MDAERFDAWSRAFAGRTSRRQALRRLAGGGLAATVLGAAGLGQSRAATRTDDLGSKTCVLAFAAKVAVGQDIDATFEGELTLTLTLSGIDQGQLKTPDDKTYPVVGQAVGRAINLRITVGDGRVLALSGTAEQYVDLCRGRIDGTFGGPQPGDLGTWFADYRRPSDQTPTPTPTPAPVIATGSAGGSGNPGGGRTGGSRVTATASPDCGNVDCGTTFVVDPVTCHCVCPGVLEKCGNVCCFKGATCTDPSSGSCSCPPGTEPCQNVCTPSCPAGQTLDPTTCRCASGCPQGQTLCNGACVPTSCPPNQLFDGGSCQCVNRCAVGQDFCTGTCVPVTSDTNNCGTCGNVCPSGMPCIGGACACPADYQYCAPRQACIQGVCQ